MRLSFVCSALIGRCYFDRKIGYFAPKECLPTDYDQERYQLMPEYSVAHIRKRYVDYLIATQRYSEHDFSSPEYGIDISLEFPLIDINYNQNKLCNSECSTWLCESCESNESIEIEKVYLDFKKRFEEERKITLFQALTEYANPFFVEKRKQHDERNGRFIGKVHRFNEDHNLEEEYIFFETEFLRLYAILWCRENDYHYIDDIGMNV